MSWQYRVCFNGTYCIHEYFMEQGHTGPVKPQGDDLDELENDLWHMLMAVEAAKQEKYDVVNIQRSEKFDQEGNDGHGGGLPAGASKES